MALKSWRIAGEMVEWLLQRVFLPVVAMVARIRIN